MEKDFFFLLGIPVENSISDQLGVWLVSGC